MKRILLAGLGWLAITNAHAQWDRYRTSTPPYGLEKVQAMIKKIKIPESDDDSYTAGLTDKVFGSLSLREQFTYQMIYGETYSQNCDGWFGDSLQIRHIYANLCGGLGDHNWSDRQVKWLSDNRDSVMALIRESSERSGHMGSNYKFALVQIHATELIPWLIGYYKKDRKDRDLLTVMLLMMKEGKYAPFLSSVSYRKLYKGDASYYDATIDYNTANEELIFQRATDFYNGIHH